MASLRSITPTVPSPEIDSRQHIFAYAIHSLDDLPGDFPVPPDGRDFRIGLFLPLDPPDWFGRSAYPPRLVLLSREAILVFAHPKCDEARARIPLADLAYFEIGHFLLIGWVRLVAGRNEILLPYNTRSQHAVDEFLRELERAYLPARRELLEGSYAKTKSFEPLLDIKFTNTLEMILDAGERVRVRYFSPPVVRWRKARLFRVRARDGGDLVAVTTRRIVWITDRRNERYDRYGTITRVASVDTVAGAQCEKTGNDMQLTIRLRPEVQWAIPVPSEQYEQAMRFVEQIYE